MSEPEEYPTGWDVSTGYYRGELRAESTGENDDRVVCLDNRTDGWTVTAGHATSDPEHMKMFERRTDAAEHFYDVLEDTDAFVRKSGEDVSVRDVFVTRDGPVQVLGIQTNGDLRVIDPTATGQDTRAGSWILERSQFEDSLASGEVEPASIQVV